MAADLVIVNDPSVVPHVTFIVLTLVSNKATFAGKRLAVSVKLSDTFSVVMELGSVAPALKTKLPPTVKVVPLMFNVPPEF